ncbi:MAG: hypothetical protein J6A08_12205 [Lachnospiraceae bacterium]|nr:hypothetical protein [Lachnospiraceae bacterium]
MTNNWMNDPAVANIDKSKLEFLQALVFESRNLTKEQMLPFLMSVAKKGADNHISFTDTEIDTIVNVIRSHSTPEELAQIDKLMKLRRK